MSDAETGTAAPGTVFNGRYEIVGADLQRRDGRRLPRDRPRARRRGRGQAAARPPPRRALRDRGAAARQPEPPARRQGARPLAGRARGSTSSWSSSAAPTSARSSSDRGDPGLPFNEAIDYARHTCEALQYVHDQQIVHRDVKPQNMILARQRRRARGLRRRARDRQRRDRRHDRGRHPALHGARGVRRRHRLARQRRLQPRRDAVDAHGRHAAPLRRRDEDRQGRARAAAGAAEALAGGLEMLPEMRIPSAIAFAEAIGVPISERGGESLAQSLGRAPVHRRVIEAIVRTAAGMFEAAACSIALVDQASGELVYEAAWGAGASEVVGMRLPEGVGLAGAVVASGEGVAVPECRKDPRCRPPGRGQDRLRALHDARHPAGQGRQADRRAVAAGQAATAARTGTRTSAAPRCSPTWRSSRSTWTRFPLSTTGGRTLPDWVSDARLRFAPDVGQPLRRDRRRLGLRRFGDRLPAGRGRQARAASSSAAGRTRPARSRAARTRRARASGTRPAG